MIVNTPESFHKPVNKMGCVRCNLLHRGDNNLCHSHAKITTTVCQLKCLIEAQMTLLDWV